MTASSDKQPDLLRQNSELRPDRIWNFSIPAWYVMIDERRFMTCPNAGACAQVCYARNGTYRFSNVLSAHTLNLTRYLDTPDKWRADLLNELSRKKFRPTGQPRTITNIDDKWLDRWSSIGGAAVRIHDSGDFFDLDYLRAWLDIARQTPDVLFYAYTKEVEMFKSLHPDTIPPNFRYLFSTGGLQDHMINPDSDRHADVFPDEDAIEKAGYASQSMSDLLAILHQTTRIGIPANNIPHFNKRMNGKRFSELGRAGMTKKEQHDR